MFLMLTTEQRTRLLETLDAGATLEAALSAQHPAFASRGTRFDGHSLYAYEPPRPYAFRASTTPPPVVRLKLRAEEVRDLRRAFKVNLYR